LASPTIPGGRYDNMSKKLFNVREMTFIEEMLRTVDEIVREILQKLGKVNVSLNEGDQTIPMRLFLFNNNKMNTFWLTKAFSLFYYFIYCQDLKHFAVACIFFFFMVDLDRLHNEESLPLSLNSTLSLSRFESKNIS